ncbi:GPX6 [Symbiodinium pilosum]|uniref:Glutathione peroxidase n=1 Tax=Symbiodinium pilosum TaxID=2952 RepID=A0A812WB98_SYMPI|nr:GPX6 [Symbiodinium pilosum]
MAEEPSVKSTTRPQAEVEPFVCADCEAVPTPEVDGWEATKQVFRTLGSLCGGGSEVPTVVTENFHELHARLLSGEMVKFAMFKNTVTLVVNVATKCLTKQNYAELFDICTELKAEPFEVLAFPCNQFGKQEQGTPEQIATFVEGSLPDDAKYSLFEKVHANGPHAHPVYHFCRYNAAATRSGRYMKPIPWNFAKFLIDKEGRVVEYYSPKVPPSKILPDIKAVLAGTKQGLPSQKPTAGSDAPQGFLLSSDRPLVR